MTGCRRGPTRVVRGAFTGKALHSTMSRFGEGGHSDNNSEEDSETAKTSLYEDSEEDSEGTGK